MKIITPRDFDSANITTSVAITETAWTAGTYPTGTRRYVLPSYDLYEVVAGNHTNDEPTAGAALEVKTWEKVGKVNAFACFDGVLQNPTTFSAGFDMTIAPDWTVCDGLALFDVSSNAVRVTVEDDVDGVVYDRTISTVDSQNISDWNDWFFAPLIYKTDLVLTDLPLYRTASVRIRMEGAGQIGEAVLGRVTSLGRTIWGTSAGIFDFSRKEFDVFGGASIIERGYSKRASFAVRISTPTLAFVQNTLASRRARPTVYIGSDDFAETIVFGFFRDFTLTLAGPSVSDCSIELEGLV